MHLVQISPYLVHPPRTGGDHRAHGLVLGLPPAGDRVTRYCQGGSSAAYRDLDFRRTIQVDEGYVERRHLHPLHDAAKLPMLLGYPNVLSDRALRLAPGPLDGLLADADVALVREPWQMPAVAERAPGGVPVVYSSHNVEAERFDGAVSGPFAERAYRRVVELERRAVEGADAVICTSERDERTYRDRYGLGGTPVVVAQNGTYAADVRERDPDSPTVERLRAEYGVPSDALVCTFVGSNYGPNVEAARDVLDIARAMRGRDPPVHFLVVGSVGRSVGTDLPNATVTGFVEDFEAHLDLTDVALNPVRSGGGTNVKMLDYLARGLPVVSTPFGVRGFDVADGEEVVLAEASEFPAAVERLRADPAERERLGRAGRELVAERYTWETTSRRLGDRLRELFLDGPRSRPA